MSPSAAACIFQSRPELTFSPFQFAAPASSGIGWLSGHIRCRWLTGIRQRSRALGVRGMLCQEFRGRSPRRRLRRHVADKRRLLLFFCVAL